VCNWSFKGRIGTIFCMLFVKPAKIYLPRHDRISQSLNA
jgi:hypothetical protein